jgi:hypothetical protein
MIVLSKSENQNILSTSSISSRSPSLTLNKFTIRAHFNARKKQILYQIKTKQIFEKLHVILHM